LEGIIEKKKSMRLFLIFIAERKKKAIAISLNPKKQMEREG
jgi:hypothetical protein